MISLYGNYYTIRGPIQVGFAQNPPVRRRFTVSDLTGGVGLYRYRNVQTERKYYWTGQNIDTLTPYNTTLGPLATSSSKPAGETRTVNVITALGGTIIVCFEDRVYNLTPPSTWSALIDTLPATPIDDLWFNSRIFYALGASGYSYQATAAGVATDVATPTVQSFVEWDGRLWSMDTSGVLRWSSTGNASTWTDKATIPIQDLTDVELVVYDDSAGDSTIWALTTQGPWIYDALNDKWFPSRFQFPGITRLFTGRGLGTTFRNHLITKGTDMSVYRLTMNGSMLIVKDITPGIPGGLPVSLSGELKTFTADNNFLFVAVGNSTTVTGVNWTIFALTITQDVDGSDIETWHPIYVNTTPNTVEPKAMSIISGSNGHRLYFHDNNVTDGHIVRFIDLVDLRESPVNSTTKTYTTGGAGIVSRLELPYFDGEEPGKQDWPKVALRYLVKLAGAASTETVQVAYRSDFSVGSYTNLGAVVNSDTEASRWFGTNNVGLEFKSIQPRITFVRGGTSTLRPILEYLALDYLEIPPTLLRQFTVVIDCSTMINNLSPGNQITNLWTALQTSTLGTFSYRDDAGNTLSYLVKVVSPQGQENAGYDFTGLYTLNLIEIRAN